MSPTEALLKTNGSLLTHLNVKKASLADSYYRVNNILRLFNALLCLINISSFLLWNFQYLPLIKLKFRGKLCIPAIESELEENSQAYESLYPRFSCLFVWRNNNSRGRAFVLQFSVPVIRTTQLSFSCVFFRSGC